MDYYIGLTFVESSRSVKVLGPRYVKSGQKGGTGTGGHGPKREQDFGCDLREGKSVKSPEVQK